MKKITSMFLALVMALALAVPAFASSGTVKVEGSIQLPTLNVVLPTTASMVMNPYKMSVKLDPRDPASAVTDQIVSDTMEVKNLSNIDVQVGIKVTGSIKNTADTAPAFAASSAASDSTNKTAYIYVAFEVGDADLDVTDTNGSGNSTVVLTTAEQEPTDFASNAVAGNANTLKASADLKAPSSKGVLGFKFFGDTSKVTTWTDKDVMAATIAFTFTPLANATTPATPGVTVTSTNDSPAAGGSATLTATLQNIDASKNPTYAWTATDNDSILDSFSGGTSATQAVTIAAGATTGQTADVTVTVTYDDAGSQDATVTDTITITVG